MEIKNLFKNNDAIAKIITVINKETKIGYIIYTRNETETYHVSGRSAIPEKGQIDDKMKWLIQEDLPEDFPDDDLDKVVLSIVQASYPQSQVKSSSIKKGEDIRNIMELRRYSITMTLHPDVNTNNLNKYSYFSKNICMYSEMLPDEVENVEFTTICQLENHEEVIKCLYKINFVNKRFPIKRIFPG